jgi:hypothetical protein
VSPAYSAESGVLNASESTAAGRVVASLLHDWLATPMTATTVTDAAISNKRTTIERLLLIRQSYQSTHGFSPVDSPLFFCTVAGLGRLSHASSWL